MKHVINIKIINEVLVIFYTFFKVFIIQCEFYTYSTSELQLATFQVLISRVWLVTITLDSPALANMRVRKEALSTREK